MNCFKVSTKLVMRLFLCILSTFAIPSVALSQTGGGYQLTCEWYDEEFTGGSDSHTSCTLPSGSWMTFMTNRPLTDSAMMEWAGANSEACTEPIDSELDDYDKSWGEVGCKVMGEGPRDYYLEQEILASNGLDDCGTVITTLRPDGSNQRSIKNQCDTGPSCITMEHSCKLKVSLFVCCIDADEVPHSGTR